MLVLTRRTSESIMIGDDVRIVVLDVRGDVVRVGIEAPRSVQVHRAEVYAEVVAAQGGERPSSDEIQRLQQVPRPHRSGLRSNRSGTRVPVQNQQAAAAISVQQIDITALEQPVTRRH